MLQLSTLGSLNLRSSDGTEVRPVLAQPKRFALLAYLAVAHPRGFHRRDRLIALFWPGVDEARARRALSQALTFLRNTLPEQVLHTRGTEEVGVLADALTADAVVFERALESGRFHEALELYGGDFLSGFHAGDAWGFDDWASAERDRLRKQAADCAWALAWEQLDQGAVADAEGSARRALDLQLTDESAVREFIGALAAAGDRAAAVRFYERFAEALAEELELRPHAETRKLVEDIRASKGSGEAAALAGLKDEAGTQSASVMDRLRATLGDRYLIEREIGRGGMATVYVAHDLKHDRKVAFKVLAPDLAATVGTDRFLREIKTAARLAHPHILPLLDSGQADDLLYYVMPHVAGESLRARLDREGQLPVDEAVRITREVADALVYAHEQNVLHRDVKPSNILLEAGHAVLADFGVARALAGADEDRAAQTDGGGLASTGRTDLTRTGTPAYMSPEQASGERPLSWASDQYALACVTYEMLTGQPPLTDGSVGLILEKKQRGELPSLLEVRPELPPEMGTAVMRALATDPADRFASVGEFADALDAVAAAEPRTLPKRRWPRWTAAAALVTGVVLSWYVGASRSGGPRVNRIAVLPVPDFSVGAEPGATDGGFQDELTRKLDQIPGISPISRTSVDAWATRETRSTIPELAAEADLDYVVEASLQKWGDSIRFTVQLIDARTDRHLWSRDYAARYSVAEYVRLQSELVQAIAYDLRAHVSPENLAWLEAVPTRSLEAFEAYREAIESYRSETNLVKIRYRSTDLLERAVELDPEFGAARAWLALSLRRSQDPALRERGRIEAERALAQAEDLWEAHLALAEMYRTPGDEELRRQHLEAALERAPPLEKSGLRRQLALMDADADEVLAIFEEERRRDPLNAGVQDNLSLLYMIGHRYEEALAALERWTALSGDRPALAIRREMMIHLLRGNLEQSRALHRVLLEQAYSVYGLIPGSVFSPILRTLSDDQRAEAWHQFLETRDFRLSEPDLYPDYRGAVRTPSCWGDRRVGQVGSFYCIKRAIHERDVGSPETAAILWDSLRVAVDSLWSPAERRLEFFFRALVYTEAGVREAAIESARTAVTMSGGCGSWIPFAPCPMLARALARFGQYDDALDLVEEMLTPPSLLTVHMLQLDPWWRNLWGHPRFERILVEYADQVEVAPEGGLSTAPPNRGARR